MGIKKENISNHASTTTLIFTHRTLKRGFSNHVLMQDLIKTGDAVFNGIYRNEQGSLRRGFRVWGRGVLRAVRHRSYAIEIAFSCYLCLQFCILHPSSFICIVLTLKGQNERRRFLDVCVCVCVCLYIYKKRPGLSRVCLGRPAGSIGFRRVLLRPGPVPGLGRPGRPAGSVQVSKLWQEHTTHLNEKYKRLSTDYKELVHPFISPMVLGMTNLLFPLQRRLCFSFIIFEQINLQ